MEEAAPCVVRFVVSSNAEGEPSVEDMENSAPLIVLPRPARDELHKLLWYMMQVR